MRIVAAFAMIAFLAACGADGAPKPPAAAPESGLTVNGQVKIGISG